MENKQKNKHIFISTKEEATLKKNEWFISCDVFFGNIQSPFYLVPKLYQRWIQSRGGERGLIWDFVCSLVFYLKSVPIACDHLETCSIFFTILFLIYKFIKIYLRGENVLSLQEKCFPCKFCTKFRLVVSVPCMRRLYCSVFIKLWTARVCVA